VDLAVLTEGPSGNGGVRVLVVNAGSSSLKLRALGSDDTLISSGDLPPVRGEADRDHISDYVRGLEVDAVGHRIVHGGSDFTGPVRIQADVEDRLRALTDLAPLHQPKSLAALDAVTAALPDLPAVACFDTAFHASLPEAAATYAIPKEWRDRWKIRRYGFHGLSHAYASRRAAEVLGRTVEELRIVTCHLGAGASLAAVEGGRSVDTTMGFTPLEGLVMATRSGSIDPGLVLWLQQHVGMPPEDLGDALEHRSGLVGLAGTADMREALERRAAGDPDAALGVDVYLHRFRAEVASMVAAMDGLDILAFTGGVGENSADIRRLACTGLSFVEVDDDRNARGSGDRDISTETSPVRVIVVAAREDLQIALEVRRVLGD
jgi:acetate kinase